MNLKDFYNELVKHDWFFNYSDSHDVYTAGLVNEDKLMSISKTSGKHRELFKSYERYVRYGGDKDKLKVDKIMNEYSSDIHP